MPEASKKRPSSSTTSSTSSSRPSKMMKRCTEEDENEGNSSDSEEDEDEVPVTGMDTSTSMNACVYVPRAVYACSICARHRTTLPNTLAL